MNYTYDFNYSMTFQSMPKAYTFTNEQRQMMNICKQYQLMSPCKNKEMSYFLNLLVKQTIFIQIGELLKQISQIQLQLIPKNIQNRNLLDHLRQQLCQKISQINIILGNDKQYYLNIIILHLTMTLMKTFKNIFQTEIQLSLLFHLLYWQVRGQHSVNNFYQRLFSDILDPQSIQRFLQGKQKMISSVQFSHLQKKHSKNLEEINKRNMLGSFSSAMNNQNLNSMNSKGIMQFSKISKQSIAGQINQKLKPKTFGQYLSKKH